MFPYLLSSPYLFLISCIETNTQTIYFLVIVIAHLQFQLFKYHASLNTYATNSATQYVYSSHLYKTHLNFHFSFSSAFHPLQEKKKSHRRGICQNSVLCFDFTVLIFFFSFSTHLVIREIVPWLYNIQLLPSQTRYRCLLNKSLPT